MQKNDVNGKQTQEAYRWLRVKTLHKEGTEEVREIPWNFAKFLVSGDGKKVKFYDSRIEPNKILPDIKAYLN